MAAVETEAGLTAVTALEEPAGVFSAICSRGAYADPDPDIDDGMRVDCERGACMSVLCGYRN